MNDATLGSPFSPRSEKAGFPDRTNPRRAAKPSAAGGQRARRVDASYPAKCNPTKSKPPLNDVQQALTVRYLPMAQKLARRAERDCPSGRDEFESVALLALVEAAQSFEPSRKVGFPAFARYRIQGALYDARRELVSFTRKCRSGNIPQTQSFNPKAEHLGKVVVTRVPTPVGAELEAADTMENWLRKLPALQSAAFRHIYIDGKTQEETAVLVGCSKSAMCRIHQETINWFHRSGWLSTPSTATPGRDDRAKEAQAEAATVPSDDHGRTPAARSSRSKSPAHGRTYAAAAV